MSEEKKVKVRLLRHWKQRFDKDAAFIWRKSIMFGVEQYEPGDPIPEELIKMPSKLRRFWESKVIELAEFKEPLNVATGSDFVYPEVGNTGFEDNKPLVIQLEDGSWQVHLDGEVLSFATEKEVEDLLRVSPEAEKIEAEKIEAEKIEAEKIEAEKIEAEKIEAEKIEAEKIEAEKIEAEKIEAEKIEAEKIEAEKIEAEKIEAEKIETEKIEAEKIEAEKIEAEKIEAEKIEAEKIEAEKIEAEKIEAEKIEAEKIEAEKIEAEKIEGNEDGWLTD